MKSEIDDPQKGRKYEYWLKKHHYGKCGMIMISD